MRIKIIRTQKIYSIITGDNFSLSYNEDLSKGKILLREKEYIDLIPHEEVKLLDLDFAPGYYYFCIGNANIKETRNKTGDKIYTYEIDLMSQTKLLENYLLPSLSITPKTNGGLSIYAYMDRYNNLFGPKIRTESGFVNKFSFDIECQNKFADVCPELQFNAPTLRECLTLLMQVKDCIPVVNNNVISFIDLSKKQRQQDIEDSHISYIERSRSAEDYVSDIKVEMKNVIQDDEYIDCVENISLRNYDGKLVNDETMNLYTQHPIYDIVSFKLCGCVFHDRIEINLPDGTTIMDDKFQKYFETDLKNDLTYPAIVEKKKWITLNSLNTTIRETRGRPNNLGLYRNSTLYYERGNNIIQNIGTITLGNKREWVDPEPDRTTIQLIEEAIAGKPVKVDEFISIERNTFKAHYMPEGMLIWKKIAFKIRYKTKANCVAKLGKSKQLPVHREILDNQSNNYVNAYTQGLLEYAKANRLGNQISVISARYPKNYDMPLVGDYFNKNDIIYKADYQINANTISATFYTCPNYVLRNYFTGINSKLRSWKIVDTSEAFYREEHKKFYLEFSYSQFKEENEFLNEGQEFMRYALGSLDEKLLQFKSLYIRNYPMLRPDDYYVMEHARNVVGNSIVFTFGFEDNYTFGMYIVDRDAEGGSAQQMYSYTDENGNYERMAISLVKDYKLYNPEFVVGQDINNSDVDRFINKLYAIPLKNYDLQTLFASIELTHFKDNKEIIKQNLQFEYCAEEGIYLGDEFIKGQINQIAKTDLILRISDVEPDGNVLPTGTDYNQEWVIDDSEESSSLNNTIKLSVNVPMSDTQYAYIYNKNNNNILLAWKGKDIYLNMLVDRDKAVYKKNDEGEWVDKDLQ